MPLINCKINLISTSSESCVIGYTDVSNQSATFAITETKFYVPVVTLSTQDISKLLQQLKSGFKRTTNWKNYLSKRELLPQNPNLNHSVEKDFQGVNILFVLAFENDTQRTSSKGYYLPNIEIKNYNVVIDGKYFLINQ